MSSDRFDNVYLNGHFFELDHRRRMLGLDSVLPLHATETGRYIQVRTLCDTITPCVHTCFTLPQLTTWRLTRPERMRLVRSATFLLTSAVQVGSMLAIDYALHWLLATVRYYGLQQAGIESTRHFSSFRLRSR